MNSSPLTFLIGALGVVAAVKVYVESSACVVEISKPVTNVYSITSEPTLPQIYILVPNVLKPNPIGEVSSAAKENEST